MKKISIILLVMFFVNNSHAQTWDEWFNQKSTQKKYLLQQIAAFEAYLSYAKKGYDIASKGISTISSLNVKDLFVFCCYTGLSYVDVMGLKPANIVSSLDGFQWIKTNRAKTDVAVDVPLLEQAVVIWEKFKNRKGELPRDTVFPYITNQEMNRSLKVIGEVCKITKILTFHLARHTFATTVTLCNGVPIESISKMLGHTKLTTTMLYAKVVKTKLSMDMALLQSKLNKSNKHLSVAI